VDDEHRPAEEPSAEVDAVEPEKHEDVTESDEPVPFVPSPFPRMDVEDAEDAEPEAEDLEAPVAGILPEVPVVKAPKRRLRTTGKVVLALVSVVAVAVTGYAYVTTNKLQATVNTTDALTQPDDKAAPPVDDGATDILLVGSDARTDAEGAPLPARMLKNLRTEDKAGVNTDTIIILRIPKNGGKAAGISIPRDSWVDVPGRGKTKINSAYGVAKANYSDQLRAQGETDRAKIERESDQVGRKTLVQTVQDFTQLRIDHYAEVNLLGFYLITEALGGVQVCLNHATSDKDSGADFRAGVQTVSGGQALSFVRQRENLPRGDLDRIVRQQTFLSSALQKVMSAGTLASPSKTNALLDAVHRSVVLDPGLDLLDFAEQVKGIASGSLTFTTIPVVNSNGRSEDGKQSIVQVDPTAVRQFVASLAGRTALQAPPPGGVVAGGGGGEGGGGGPFEMASGSVPCVN
jgi:LCP family protein required for cell wall assembly